MAKKCCVCGEELAVMNTYSRSYHGNNYEICERCNTAFKRMDKAGLRDSATDYLRKKLESGSVAPYATALVKNYLQEEITEEESSAAQNIPEYYNTTPAPSGSGTMYIVAVCFLILAVILYFVSVNNDYGVANIQSTVFSAAAFIASVVCFAAGKIIKAINMK